MKRTVTAVTCARGNSYPSLPLDVTFWPILSSLLALSDSGDAPRRGTSNPRRRPISTEGAET
jgi:hypothetical protein